MAEEGRCAGQGEAYFSSGGDSRLHVACVFAQLLEAALAHFNCSKPRTRQASMNFLFATTACGMSMKTSSAWICAVNLSSKTPTKRIYSCTETKMTRTPDLNERDRNDTIRDVRTRREIQAARALLEYLGSLDEDVDADGAPPPRSSTIDARISPPSTIPGARLVDARSTPARTPRTSVRTGRSGASARWRHVDTRRRRTEARARRRARRRPSSLRRRGRARRRARSPPRAIPSLKFLSATTRSRNIVVIHTYTLRDDRYASAGSSAHQHALALTRF